MNPFTPPKPLTISRAKSLVKTLEWRGVETPVNLLVQLTGFSAAQIREVLANTDQINEYLDVPISVRKRTSIKGHQYYLATVGQHKQEKSAQMTSRLSKKRINTLVTDTTDSNKSH